MTTVTLPAPDSVITEVSYSWAGYEGPVVTETYMGSTPDAQYRLTSVKISVQSDGDTDVIVRGRQIKKDGTFYENRYPTMIINNELEREILAQYRVTKGTAT